MNPRNEAEKVVYRAGYEAGYQARSRKAKVDKPGKYIPTDTIRQMHLEFVSLLEKVDPHHKRYPREWEKADMFKAELYPPKASRTRRISRGSLLNLAKEGERVIRCELKRFLDYCDDGGQLWECQIIEGGKSRREQRVVYLHEILKHGSDRRKAGLVT